MAITLEERAAKAREKAARLEQRHRIDERKIRDELVRQGKLRNFILGKIVAKHFPEVKRFEPKTKDENVVVFAEFDLFLAMLAEDHETVTRLRAEVERRLTTDLSLPVLDKRTDTSTPHHISEEGNCVV